MSEVRKVLLDLAQKKEIKYSISKIRRAKEEDLQQIWIEVQQERLSETNDLIAHTFVDKMCEILESVKVIDKSEDTAEKLKCRKAFMKDMNQIAGYFSALIPYIGLLEGGIVLGKDVVECRYKDKYETSSQTKQGENKSESSKTSSDHEGVESD